MHVSPNNVSRCLDDGWRLVALKLKRPPRQSFDNIEAREKGLLSLCLVLKRPLRVCQMSDRVNILMVDDQPGKLLSYEVVLAKLDENLIKSHSAKEALQLLLK